MASGGPDWGRISAIFGIVASLGGVAGFFFSPDTQRCTGLRGIYRGDPLHALQHCADEHGLNTTTPPVEGAIASPPAVGSPPSTAPVSEDPRDFGGTKWVFYDGQNKTYVTFGDDDTVTFSDPAYGSGGLWQLAGTRGIAFHTDTYEFGGTIGRGVPDSFVVSYRHLPRGASPEPELTATFTRVNG